MIAEGDETPGDAAGGGEGRGRRGDGDLLSERRARRAVESGEHALTLRAEAAEATVRTLETHVASLQRRLQDAEEEGRRIAELLDAAQTVRSAERSERAPPPAGVPAFERELQRAAQREYAEQRLRIEVEERAAEREREARVELERMSRRVSAGERDVEALAARLEAAERELAEAEQAAASERAAAIRAERELSARVGELERRAGELQGLLEQERTARSRAERALEQLRAVQRTAQAMLGGLAETVASLRAAARAPESPIASDPAPTRPAPDAPASAGRAPFGSQPVVPRERAADAQGGEMAAALAAAVERLRARVEEQAARDEPPAPMATRPPAPPAWQLPRYKHSMSLIARTRLRIRLRRERRKQRDLTGLDPARLRRRDA